MRQLPGDWVFQKASASGLPEGAADRAQPCFGQAAQGVAKGRVCKRDRYGEPFGKLQSKKSYASGGDDGAQHKAEAQDYTKHRTNPTAASPKDQHVD